MIGADVYCTLGDMTQPSTRRVGITVFSGQYERRAFGEITECMLEVQRNDFVNDIRLNAAMDFVMIGAGSIYEFFFITGQARRQTYHVLRGESMMRYLEKYYPDWYAGTSDARWSGDAAQGIATVLRPTEFRATHWGSLPISYHIVTPAQPPAITTVNVPFAWASRVEAAQQITREVHQRGYPLVWWFESGAYIAPISLPSGVYWQIPCVYLVFGHWRQNKIRSRAGIHYDVWVNDRSRPTAGISLGYGTGIDRAVMRTASFFSRNSIWAYTEGRVDGRASGVESTSRAVAAMGRPQEGGDAEAGWQTAPRLGDQIPVTAGDGHRYIGSAWVVSEKYTVEGARIADMQVGVMWV